MDVNYLSQYFVKAPSSWTHKEIILWLELLNMKEYQNEFEINKVDGLIIFDLEDKEIEEIIGIKNSIHRKRLRNGINILKQFQQEFEKKNKKSGGNKSNGDIEFEDNMPPLNTAQPAQGFSGKKNNLRQFNSQTAPRRDLENVFNFNALAHFDAEKSYQPPRTYTWDPCIEEEKVSENVILNDHTAFDNKMDKFKNNNSMKPEKPFEQAPVGPAEHDSSHSDPASMNIEEDEPNKQLGNQNDYKLVKRSFSAKDDYARSPKESIASPLSCHQGPEPMSRIGDIENQLDRFSRLGQDLKPVTVQTHPAELIIQPVDGVQSNNFYCINENGGRIGRHSNNEIVILEESVSRHHSIIEFKENKFYLVDIGSTTGSFIRIETPLILVEGMILELGSNQFFVEKITPKDAENGELRLKVIEGMHVDRVFIIANSATIGRKGQFSPTTIALVDDLHLSNTHTKISYVDSHFILEDLGSTNGSWLRMSPEGVRSKSFELNDGLVFKIGASSTFKVKRSNISYLEMMQSPKNHDGSMNCAICYENDRDVVFIPCKHNVVCMKCSKNIKQCPVCRFKINDIIRIYKS